ncbi:mechanosensitive ion channel [Microbacterium sp. ISL-103]|uniref:mechanosensitive ion channel domain-containing protein n=1 Tax=Microbacterium sp. ISL-103 TaxID=2819156 RepID=UPI001BE6C8F9|nr:mechanosensitive ion channel domain-containing protein [Microbacterium sp. ISL-103]MBT2474864.1 mechanosensitive ion channel [Microbacterium sp. ISL-103]
MSINLSGEWVGWAIAVAVGVPLMLVVLTEAIGALNRRGHAAAKPLRLLRNWVVPVGGLCALLAMASRSETDQVWTRVVATVLGFLVILLVLSAFNVALFSRAEEGSWRERIPSIFVEIARLILVVVGLGFLFQWVWGADVGGLVAALGVTSIVIGLALQNAVGGVISGLLLLFEQPFKIGDWLEVGGIEGRVVEVNWRAVHIDTGSGIQIVPNSSLSGASFTNKSLPEAVYRTTVNLKFGTDDSPQEVIKLLLDVAEALPQRPVEHVATAEYSGAGAFSVTLPVMGAAAAPASVSLYLSWLWYAARRRGIALDGDTSVGNSDQSSVARALETVGPVLQVGEAERRLLAESAKVERYGAGELLQLAGAVPTDIRFVVDGAVRTWLDTPAGRIDLNDVEAGDYVGQTALTREPAIGTSVARTVVTVLTVPSEVVDKMVQTRPRLAMEIGQSIERKRKLAAEAMADAGLTRSVLPGSPAYIEKR